MNILSDLFAPLSNLCRTLLEIGGALFFHTTLLLLFGLAAGRLLARRFPLALSAIYKSTLAMVALSGLLSLLFLGRVPAFWSLHLPNFMQEELVAPTQMAELAMPEKAYALPQHAPYAPAIPPAIIAEPAPATGIAGGVSADSPGETTSSVPPPSLAPPATGWSVLYIGLCSVWALGAGMLLAGLIAGQLQLRGIRQRSVVVADWEALTEMCRACNRIGIRVPHLLISQEITSPFVVGLFNPALILPATYREDFDPPVFRAVLAHELTHLRERDGWWMLGMRIACIVGWIHPLLWKLSRRMEEAQETVCDHAALDQGCLPSIYAQCLLTLAERTFVFRPERTLGMGMTSSRSALGERIEGILNRRPGSHRPLSWRQKILFRGSLILSAWIGWALVAAQAAPELTPPAVQDVAVAEKTGAATADTATASSTVPPMPASAVKMGATATGNDLAPVAAARDENRQDRIADALLMKMQGALQMLSTLSADFSFTSTVALDSGATKRSQTHGTLQLKRPNYACVIANGPDLFPNKAFYSDGDTIYTVSGEGNRYQAQPAGRDGADIEEGMAMQVGLFFHPTRFLWGKFEDARRTSLGKETIQGETFDGVKLEGGEKMPYTAYLYLNEAGLPVRIRLTVKYPRAKDYVGSQDTFEYALSHIRTDVPLPDRLFAFQPKKGMERFDPASETTSRDARKR